MMITRDNYETWFLDYLEGKLDKEHREMVEEFLRKNPDIEIVSDEFMPALAGGLHPVYPHKERLKKTWHDDPALLESTVIAAMEGDLTGAERNKFDKWAENNPDARKIIHILGSTKLQPDLNINFPDKGRLKRTTVPAVTWVRIAAAAAILMLAFLVFYPSGKKAETSSSITAETVIPPEKSNPVNSPVTAAEPSMISKEEDNNKRIPASPSSPVKIVNHTPEPLLAATRSFVPIEKLEPKSAALTSVLPAYADLILIKRSAPVYYASGEIPLSVFFHHRLQALKASQTNDSFTREEFKVAGLRLFSRIPGSHLTGKKGKDGRLKSISFNTQMLAFSIPVNQ